MSQTEIIQPCNDWQEYLLGDVAQTTSGGTPDRSKKEFYQGTIPWVKSGELNDTFIDSTEEHISEEGLRKSSAKLFPTGALLMAMYGATVGKTAILRIEAATNQAVCGILPDETKTDTEFLRCQLIFFRKKLLSERYGGAQPNISQTIIKNIQLRLPPLPEQRRIAHILTTVQTAIEQQDRMIALTRELKSALMHKLFTEGLRGEKQKQTEIGLMPESWEMKKLQEAVEFIDYGYSAPIPKSEPENGIKIVSTADINRAGDLLYWKIRRTVAPESTVKRLTLRDGDVLFNWRNSAELIGKTTIFEKQTEQYIFASFILRIRCDEKKTHNYYLKYLLNHYREQEVFVKLSRRAVNQANYNRNEIFELKIPFPKCDEQCEIAKTIGTVESKIHFFEAKKQLLEELFRTLLHQLMTGQIRVNEIELSELIL